MIVGCASKNDHNRGAYFARIPSVVSNQGEEAEKLSKEGQLRWISAISRADRVLLYAVHILFQDKQLKAGTNIMLTWCLH